MKTIYCISGLGADERAFSKLKIAPGYRLKIIPWLKPLKDETIAHYAERMRKGIDEEEPILLGLSFGGIMCTEIAKQIDVEKIIIISSIKNSLEMPIWMKTAAVLKLHKILPLKSTKMTESLQNKMLGVTDTDDLQIARDYRKNADMQYINWAVDKAINWKNSWVHPAIYHIHGDKDKMFPINRIKATYTVKDAGHFMIMNKAEEVSAFINLILQDN